MNTTLTKPKATKAPKARGRKQTSNSIRMSRAMFIMRKVDGLQLHEIADKYNGQKRRQGKTLTPQAVHARVTKFALQFPADAAQLLGQAPAAQAQVEAPTVAAEKGELVLA